MQSTCFSKIAIKINNLNISVLNIFDAWSIITVHILQFLQLVCIVHTLINNLLTITSSELTYWISCFGQKTKYHLLVFVIRDIKLHLIEQLLEGKYICKIFTLTIKSGNKAISGKDILYRFFQCLVKEYID